MHPSLSLTKKILEDLVSFPVLPGDSNLEMVDYIADYLSSHGVDTQLIYSEDDTRANIFATIGPSISGGIMLSGHTDVVSVEGQNWTDDPFKLTEKNQRLYGRGAVDMKGFLASCLASIGRWQELTLTRPIQLGITYDEENGGFGAKRLAAWLNGSELKPAHAIIGEPTGMTIIAGHKGGYEISTKITGAEAHSCNPEMGISAVHYAAQIINYIVETGVRMKQASDRDCIFDPPYGSFNIGKIHGGSSVNTVAGHCEFDWEFRPLPDDDREQILTDIDDYCQRQLLPQMRQGFPRANIETNIKVYVPALSLNSDSETINMIGRISGNHDYDVVTFGTDAGYFQDIGIDSIVYGPGSINQAHKPDEYISLSEIEKCLVFLDNLGDSLGQTSGPCSDPVLDS